MTTMNDKEEPKPIHKQIIDAVGGEDRFREIAGLKPKQETLEDLLNKKANQSSKVDLNAYANGLDDGAKWQAEQMEKLKDFDVWKEWKNRG
jgi:hypothetical protein